MDFLIESHAANPSVIAPRQISVVIIALNEAERIGGTVQSCQTFADEIVLVDGGSQDNTVQIAQMLGCQVYRNSWSGYAKQRNFGAIQAKFDWIFFLDADETIDHQLRNSLLNWKQHSKLEANAFSCDRIGDFLDGWLHGRPERHIRLYNKTVFQIKDALVHERVDINNSPVGNLSGTVLHRGFRNLSDLVIRFNRYTDLDAQESYNQGRRFSKWRLCIKPPAKFLQMYLWNYLWQQGVSGFTVAVLWSYYIFLKEIKLYELSSENSAIDPIQV